MFYAEHWVRCSTRLPEALVLELFEMSRMANNIRKYHDLEGFYQSQNTQAWFFVLMECPFSSHQVQIYFTSYEWQQPHIQHNILSLFLSSGQSLWPVELCITNLPPDIRMNTKYLLLAGVWLGPGKPDMSIVLKQILEKIYDLHSIGISISTPDGSKTFKAMLLAAVFDLPAKAMALNFTQYNGYYGCSYCLDAGVHIAKRHLYLPNELHSPTCERTIFSWAEDAEDTGCPLREFLCFNPILTSQNVYQLITCMLFLKVWSKVCLLNFVLIASVMESAFILVERYKWWTKCCVISSPHMTSADLQGQLEPL